MQNHLHVAIDIGSVCHRVAIGLDDGVVIDELHAVRSQQLLQARTRP